jgi:hypothetical protein
MKKSNLSKCCFYVLAFTTMLIYMQVDLAVADEKRAPTEDETRLLQIEYRLLDLDDQRKIIENMLYIAKNKDIIFVPVPYLASGTSLDKLPKISENNAVPLPVTRLQMTQAIKAKFPRTTKEELNQQLAQMERYSSTYTNGLKNDLPKLEIEIQNLKDDAVVIRRRIDEGTKGGNLAPAEPPAKPHQGQIQVLKAIYGQNCPHPSDVTGHLAAACNGKQNCRYQVDHRIIGDPAYLCRKDYIYEWQCGNDQEARYEQTVSPEASGSYATLSCQ